MPDMAYSVPYNSFAPNPVTRDGKTLQSPVAGTVPRGFQPFRYGRTPDEALRAGRELRNPIPRSPETLAQGRIALRDVLSRVPRRAGTRRRSARAEDPESARLHIGRASARWRRVRSSTSSVADRGACRRTPRRFRPSSAGSSSSTSARCESAETRGHERRPPVLPPIGREPALALVGLGVLAIAAGLAWVAGADLAEPAAGGRVPALDGALGRALHLRCSTCPAPAGRSCCAASPKP